MTTMSKLPSPVLADINSSGTGGNKRMALVVPVHQLDLALQSLTIGVHQVKGEEVLGTDLSRWFDVHRLHRSKCSEVSRSSSVGVDRILICQPGHFFSVSTTGLLLKVFKVVQEIVGVIGPKNGIDAFEEFGDLLESKQRPFQKMSHVNALSCGINNISRFVSRHCPNEGIFILRRSGRWGKINDKILEA
ncbi:hypothetical protein HG530_000161 [Fusarium avenaceum]|nr:hypothetical protein HG530_000161 [Fusarium avenaceum]